MVDKIVIVPPRTVDPEELRLFFEQLCKAVNAFHTDEEGGLTPSEVLGTTNQVIVTIPGDGTIVISSPQDTDTNADVEFDSATLDDLVALRLVSSSSLKRLISTDFTDWIAGSDLQPVNNDGDVRPEDNRCANESFSRLINDVSSAFEARAWHCPCKDRSLQGSETIRAAQPRLFCPVSVQ